MTQTLLDLMLFHSCRNPLPDSDYFEYNISLHCEDVTIIACPIYPVAYAPPDVPVYPHYDIISIKVGGVEMKLHDYMEISPDHELADYYEVKQCKR